MYPHQAHQDFRQQRMSLTEFTELIDTHVSSVFVAYRALETTINLQDTNNALNLISNLHINNFKELEVHLKDFHDSVEFSAYLPLAVVPFLLPLLALLKKALLLIACIKQALIEPSLQIERYKQIQEEMNALKDIFDDIASQARFSIQKAKFREKSLRKIS